MDKETGGRDVGRLNAFTDGVIVVSMTLLILDVRLPESLGELDGMRLIGALAALWPKYLGYILSFVVIAQFWLGYTNRFGALRQVDETFVVLNILLLLVIGFIPFVTALLSTNHGAIALSLYAGTMMLVSLLLTAMWLYAASKGLLEAPSESSQRWVAVSAWLQIAGVFGLSILIAQYDAHLAKLSWLLLMVPGPKLRAAAQ